MIQIAKRATEDGVPLECCGGFAVLPYFRPKYIIFLPYTYIRPEILACLAAGVK